MSSLHLKILDADRKKVLQKLTKFRDVAYLAGGTALALQIGHRISVDFDLFVQHPFQNSLRKDIYEMFGDVRYLVNTSDQISFTTNDYVSITFLHYWYKSLERQMQTSSIPLSSVRDILADKAFTMGRRTVWRDYADIFYVLQNELCTLSEIIELARTKFRGEFVPEQFLEQLVYYEDVDVVKIDWIQQQYEADQIQAVLQKKVHDYMKNISKKYNS